MDYNSHMKHVGTSFPSLFGRHRRQVRPGKLGLQWPLASRYETENLKKKQLI